MNDDYKVTFDHFSRKPVAHREDEFLIRDFPFFFVAEDDDNTTMYSGVCTELTENLAELMLCDLGNDVGVTHIVFFNRMSGTYVDTAC